MSKIRWLDYVVFAGSVFVAMSLGTVAMFLLTSLGVDQLWALLISIVIGIVTQDVVYHWGGRCLRRRTGTLE